MMFNQQNNCEQCVEKLAPYVTRNDIIRNVHLGLSSPTRMTVFLTVFVPVQNPEMYGGAHKNDVLAAM